MLVCNNNEHWSKMKSEWKIHSSINLNKKKKHFKMEKTTKKQRKICEVSTNTESKCLKRKIKCRQCQSNTPIKRKSNNFNSKIGACMRNIEKCCICIMQSYAHRTFIIIIIFQDSSQNNRMEFVIRRWLCSRGTTTTIAIANIENQIEYSLSYRFFYVRQQITLLYLLKLIYVALAALVFDAF